MDTQFDTEHNLALAQRDAGMVDEALRVFLKGIDLGAVIDPDEFDETWYHAFYGNVGRCLHLMGQIEPALVCYRKSAILLQSAHAKHIEDQGYIRLWIGELLIAKGEFCAGSRFLTAAMKKWELVSPGRNAAIDAKLSELMDNLGDCKPLSERNIERYCVAWIFGRERDFSEI